MTGLATDIDITGERYAVPSSIEFDEISMSFRVTENKFKIEKGGILTAKWFKNCEKNRNW